MGEKGNPAVESVAALDAIPLGVLKSSPETINAWLDTYLKGREIHELHRVADAEQAVAAADDEPPAGGQTAS